MKRFILAICAAAMLFAADAPTKKLSKEQSLEIENLLLRQRLAESELEKLRGQQSEWYSRVCAEAGIEAKLCAIDLQAGFVTKKSADPTPAK